LGSFVTLVLAAGAVQAQLRVVTSTTDLADIAKSIGGKHVSVEAICAGEQDPHYVQARPSYMVKLSRADLLIHVGLGLEIAWLPPLIRGARNPDINPGKPGNLDASRVIEPIDVPRGNVDRSQGDIHPFGNPHYWLDPDNGKRIAKRIADRLAQLDPKHVDDYRAALARWAKSLDAALVRWDEQMAPLRGRKVVSYHATFNYFLKRFGLVQAGYVEAKPGIPPAPAHLAKLVKSMRTDRVRVVLHERYHDRGASDIVARRGGDAKVLVLPTSVGGDKGVGSYQKLIDHLVRQVAKHLTGAP
jgi:zinc/manganese transport system substrate-binding protein